MKSIPQKALENQQKISLNLDEGVLKLIDDLAALTNANRTIMIEALILKGVPGLFLEMKAAWKGALVAGVADEKKKIKIEKLLKDLDKIEKEWNKKIKVHM